MEACELLRNLTSVKSESSWNVTYQDLYYKAKRPITRDACVRFYHVLKPLHLEMDVSGIGLEACLLQVREGINCGHDEPPGNITLHPFTFAIKSLPNVEWQCSNIEREAGGILH